MLKVYSLVILVFYCDMNIPIQYAVEWELIRQKNQSRINEDNDHKTSNRVDHDYSFGDKAMIIHNDIYKYDILYILVHLW